MATLELKASEIFKDKLGIQEAEIVIEYIETKVEKSVERNVKYLATKEDLANAKTEIARTIYIVGLVQFLVIVGSVVALINILMK